MRYNDNNRSTAFNGASGNGLSNNRLFGTSDNQQAFFLRYNIGGSKSLKKK